jgi:hypothetical protein
VSSPGQVTPPTLEEYLNQIDFLEAPIVGMCKQNQSESELREFVQKQRLLRESRQTFKAMVSGEQTAAKAIEVKPDMFADFSDADDTEA